MSYHPNSFTPSGIASGQSSRYAVAPQAIQSAISTHQQSSAWIDNKVARGNKLTDSQIEFDAAKAAYSNGKMSTADFDAALRRFVDAGRDYDRHLADFQARKQGGLTKPADRVKEFYGYTDDEADDFLREGAKMMEIRRINEARSQSCIVQKNRYRGGH